MPHSEALERRFVPSPEYVAEQTSQLIETGRHRRRGGPERRSRARTDRDRHRTAGRTEEEQSRAARPDARDPACRGERPDAVQRWARPLDAPRQRTGSGVRRHRRRRSADRRRRARTAVTARRWLSASPRRACSGRSVAARSDASAESAGRCTSATCQSGCFRRSPSSAPGARRRRGGPDGRVRSTDARRSPSSATARRTSVPSTRPSTWPASSSCPSCSCARTTSTASTRGSTCRHRSSTSPTALRRTDARHRRRRPGRRRGDQRRRVGAGACPIRRGSDVAGDEDVSILRHSRSDAGTYRPEGELDAQQRDPIDILRNRLVEGGEVTPSNSPTSEAGVDSRVGRRRGGAGQPTSWHRGDAPPRHGRHRPMRHTLTMPKLGDSVSEVVILEWHVRPGDTVAVGDPLVAVETDKIDTDVPGADGRHRRRAARRTTGRGGNGTIHRRRRLMPRTHVARDRRFGGYLDDYEPGDTYTHWPGKTITESDDHLFCLLTMAASPLHVDANYAATEMEGGRNIVVGSFVYVAARHEHARHLRTGHRQSGRRRAAPHRPMYHGDTLYGETTARRSPITLPPRCRHPHRRDDRLQPASRNRLHIPEVGVAADDPRTLATP